MADDEPVTRRECELLHDGVQTALESLEGKVDHWGKQHDDKLKVLNGSVASNTKFRIESKAIYKALAFGWATLIIPLAGILIAVLK